MEVSDERHCHVKGRKTAIKSLKKEGLAARAHWARSRQKLLGIELIKEASDTRS